MSGAKKKKNLNNTWTINYINYMLTTRLHVRLFLAVRDSETSVMISTLSIIQQHIFLLAIL